MTSMTFDALILDMDGTLLDTELVYFSARVEAASALGYADTAAFFQGLIGLPAVETAESVRRHFGAAFPFEEFERKRMEHHGRAQAAGVTPKPGAAALLEHCAAVPLPCAVATSARRATAETNLARAGLRGLLAAVVGRDEVARGKPHPDVFLLAAQRLGVAPERCLAVEDSAAGVRAAHGAGMRVAMVPDLVAPAKATRQLCHAVLDDLAAVRRLLQGRGG
jgi:beta-phosphoglucomutase-like phosphatase (HAD superfamily)